MDQDIKAAAISLLVANRDATADHEKAGRGLRETRIWIIGSARTHGMSWDEIAEHLGWSDGHALRMWYRRSGGEA